MTINPTTISTRVEACRGGYSVTVLQGADIVYVHPKPLQRHDAHTLALQVVELLAQAQAGEPFEVIVLDDGPVLQRLTTGLLRPPACAAAIRNALARKATRRGHAPLPAGGLFDETAHKQQELF